MSINEARLDQHLKAMKLPAYEREHRFCERRWRFDFAWPELKIAVEAEGGTYSGGRHTRGSGFEKDCEKYNKATELGWRVFRYTAKQIKSGEAINQLETIFTGLGEQAHETNRLSGKGACR